MKQIIISILIIFIALSTVSGNNSSTQEANTNTWTQRSYTWNLINTWNQENTNSQETDTHTWKNRNFTGNLIKTWTKNNIKTGSKEEVTTWSNQEVKTWNKQESWTGDKDEEQRFDEPFRQQQFDIISPIYEQESEVLANFAIQEEDIETLSEEFQSISEEFEELEERKNQIEERYSEVRQEISNVIRNIQMKKQTIKKWIQRIENLTENVRKLEKSLEQINKDIETTKQKIKTYTNILFKINNNFYNKESNEIDNISLLVRSEQNIANTMSEEDITKWIVFNLEKLQGKMKEKKEKYTHYKELYNDARQQYYSYISHQKENIEEYENQKEKLTQMFQYYKEDIEKYNELYTSLVTSKEEVRKEISQLRETAQEQETMVHLSADQSYWTWLDDVERNYFSWPVLPSEWISAFYIDEWYKERFWRENLSVDIPAEQWSEVYAPADWKVHHVVDQDSPSLNWFILKHDHWFVTAYLHMYQTFVEEWDEVERGEIIGLVGWEPGTRGAGNQTTWPHLHFEVIKGEEYIDPLRVLDLSVVPSRHDLQSKYYRKYMKDIYQRDFNVRNVPDYGGDTLEERRENYLSENAIEPYQNLSMWEKAAEDINVDIDLWICIAAAESSLGSNMTTSWNIWNVGNNDRWDRIWFKSPYQGARAIFLTLDNSFLWEYKRLTQLSRYKNQDWAIYASSPENWQKNVTRCLSSIKGHPVPEDYFFRIYEDELDIDTAIDEIALEDI